MKEYYRKKWLKTKNYKFYNEFSRLRSLTKTLISDSYRSYIVNMETNIKSNPAEIWKSLNNRRGHSRIPNTLHDEKFEYSEPYSIVNAFADFFSSSFSLNDPILITDSVNSTVPFGFPLICEDDLTSVMERFSNKCTSGDDLIPSFLIRDCRLVFAKPLSILFNLAIKTCTFPSLWKRARISPVFKNGDKSCIPNYRPVCILSNFGKVFEKVLYQVIYNKVKSYISPYQHGFVSGRSTDTNLSIIAQYLAEEVDNRGRVDVIYTDLSKAFDKIQHNILIQKLNNFGLNTDALALIESYLSSRVCYVYYNGFTSREFIATSGVPQGSHLGPLLFVLFINDLLLSLSCPVLAYADDIKLYVSINFYNEVLLLQSNLNVLTQWCMTHKLILNKQKCFFVTFTITHSPLLTQYMIDGYRLDKKDCMKDLGVVFDSTLTFVKHLNCVCSSVSKSLGFVMRTCRNFSDLNLMKQLFYSYVLSKIEYGILVWSPIYASHALMLDKIYRRFLKYLSYRIDGAYPERGTSSVIYDDLFV
ncbi:hypothetical protein Zmor_026980 [Zophobas morio]|uniref:Reverse transcriptase domain-containing protein n=1 Tax=Zophobas morio TaxID=2755281 RepID=A0AA38HVI3_9CUCU|nr:hypothetical protein Zmor_026980 [Zophobas morio]